MNITKKSLRLQGIIYGDMKREEQLVEDAEKAVQSGATLIRLYKGRLADSAYISLYNKISAIAKKSGRPLIIGGSADDAARFDADGAHINFTSADETREARLKLAGKALGVTVKTADEALSAQECGADYLEVGGMFNTDGRRESRILSLQNLNEIVKAVSIPVIASGGITEDNAEVLSGSCIDGVASNHSVFFRHDIRRATSVLRCEIDKIVLPQSKIQGAIFDMDGTLIDSMAIWKDLGARYLESLNITPKPDLNEAVKTLSMRQSSSYFKYEYNIDLSCDEIYHGLSRIIKEFYNNEAKLKDGVLELLNSLRERRVPMILLTATNRRLTENVLRRCGIYDYFDTILTSEEFGQSKAHSAIFKEACRVVGAPPSTTWVFEDALYAVAAAKRVGLKVAAVYDETNRRDWETICRKADIAVKSFEGFPLNKIQ